MNNSQSYTLPVAALRAVLLATPTKDVRYYLVGVLVEPAADRVALVGTDGHRLHCVVHPAPGTAAGEPFIIPRDMVAAIVKGAKKGADVTIVATPRGEFCRSWELELRRDDGLAVRGHSVDGTFPDWRRIVPRESGDDASPAQFNYEFLADAQRAAGELAGQKVARVNVAHRGPHNTALVTCEDLPQFFAVVMPIRTDKAQPGGFDAISFALNTPAPGAGGAA